MTNKARELLERALEELIFQNAALRWDEPKVIAEIRAYLAEPEVKREALSEDEVKNYLCRIPWMESLERVAFKYGVRFAEKHHGVGDNNENTNT